MSRSAKSKPSALSRLPSVDALLRSESGGELVAHYGRPMTTDAVRDALASIRKRYAKRADVDTTDALVGEHAVLARAKRTLAHWFEPSLRPVINLTGVVLHTNLGRAVYPEAVMREVSAVATRASNLEFDLHTGSRGNRDSHVSDWICRLTGAEAATVVNNNAAAVLLVLNALGHGREIIVSRGELIEIGGSFRMPDIMERAGVRLREVGTTNRTHLKDYADAIGDETAALMKVHPSNYEVKGFTQSVGAEALSHLAKANDIVLIDDLGSGCLVDMSVFGLPKERTVGEALNEGVDVVTFSGDKLLGGPQCGIIAGSKRCIDTINRNPMKRALRVDKLTLAALESILKCYADPDRLTESLPTLKSLTRTKQDIDDAAQSLAAALRDALHGDREPMTIDMDIGVFDCESEIGSGALPTRTLPSRAVVLRVNADSRQKHGVNALAAWMRALPVPVIGRIRDEALWLDCRTLHDPSDVAKQLHALVDQARSAASADV